jgi:hypothetical protein
MADIFDSDILITKTKDKLFIDLNCGYGQPCITTIYLIKNDGSVHQLKSYKNDISHEEIGDVADFKYHTLDIHTTIDDIRDNSVEMEDISLKIVVSELDSNKVSTEFSRTTKGKGFKFNSFYKITVV